MFREPQLPEQGKQVVVIGETMVIIPLDPVTIDIIGGKTTAKVRHLFNQLTSCSPARACAATSPVNPPPMIHIRMVVIHSIFHGEMKKAP
jgi:hypothetical protein